jgi:hypothetical protein
MKGLMKALKSIYDFFAGDHIIVSGVALAFAVAALLVHVVTTALIVIVAVFLGLIIGGLVVTLAREAGWGANR